MSSRTRRPSDLPARLSGAPRLVLAVVLLVAGTLVALTAAAPPATARVLVAVHGVPAGGVVAAADVALVARPTADRPASALTGPAGAVGHRVVAAVTTGEVLTAARFAPGGFAAGLAAGRSVAAVTVPAARTGVVGVGDLVRLVAASADGGAAPADTDAAEASPQTLADHARVLAVWPDPTGTQDTATLVVDVDVGSASRLAVVSADLLVGVVVLTA